MTLPANVPPDGYGPVESENPRYWQTLNEMGKRGELPERIWRSGYEKNRAWSDKFLPEVKRIIGGFIGEVLLEPASFQMDTERTSDLVLMRTRNLLFAVRIRRPGYAARYPWDFTIRSKARGGKTEWDKIVDGWGDWMFYGHADETEREIERWLLVDLQHFRSALARHPELTSRPDQPNGDGTWFKAFDARKMPPNPPVIVGASHRLPPKQLGLL